MTGSKMFLSETRVEIKHVEEKRPDPAKKRGPPLVVRVAKKYIARPLIELGPMTGLEESVVKRINNSLSTIESNFEDKIGYNRFDNPLVWDNRVKAWVRELYTRVEPLSREMSSRKKTVRLAIYGQRMNGPVPSQGKEALAQQFNKGLSPIEWHAMVETIKESSSERWEAETLHCLNAALETEFETLNEFLSLSADTIKGIFRSSILQA